MPEPTLEELTESIQSLKTYRDRLRNELISISNKLRIPSKSINFSIDNHTELNKVEDMLKKLIEQRSNQINQNK
ncbi:hypothetical protein [Prochlorococcus sp. MIT 1223]|uniref:hypothetical protein n=1 Tax=Prochlorococcus sp. MIT 1223 TaxID=3096217 RepID=UPI002A756A08|nr:hypothetical protein [Prochlorococcus sp. MIT 1223]